MKDFTIYIPTYRRTERQVTWAGLPPAVRERTVLVCPADEARALERATGGSVLVQPDHVKTISAKRQWIVDQCQTPFLCMMDDDLRFSVRDPVSGRGTSTDGGGCALVKAGPKAVERMVHELRAQLDTYAHAGISMRMGNQSRLPKWIPNKRMVYVLAYRAETLRRFARFDAIAHREDMWVTLCLLTAGYANVVAHEFTADQVYAKAGGESAAGRSMDASNADAVRLAAAFPEHVRVADKKYKVSTVRKEVVVQWERAWAKHLA